MATNVTTKFQARSDKFVYTVNHIFAYSAGSDCFVCGVIHIIASGMEPGRKLRINLDGQARLGPPGPTL